MRFLPPPFSRERDSIRPVERPQKQVVALSQKAATVRLSPPSPPRRPTKSAAALEQVAEELNAVGEAHVALDKRTKTLMYDPPLHEHRNQDRNTETGCGSHHKTAHTRADTNNDLSKGGSGSKKDYSKSASSSSDKYAALILGGGRKQQHKTAAAAAAAIADNKKAFHSHWGWRKCIAPRQAQIRRETRRCTM